MQDATPENVTSGQSAGEGTDAARVRALFEYSPMPIWEGDLSRVKARIDKLRAAGADELDAYLIDHPDELQQLAALVQVMAANQSCIHGLGFTGEEELVRYLPAYFREASWDAFRREIGALATGLTSFETDHPMLIAGTEKTFRVFLRVVPGCEDTLSRVLVSFLDVTENLWSERCEQLTLQVLAAISAHSKRKPLLSDLIALFKAFTECEAVGIRVLDDEGNIPYEAYTGFSPAFYERESPLSLHRDHCMCINVVKGDTDPSLPFYTPYGSFYMNATTKFLATVSLEAKGQTRNVCNEVGYESVALIPIRHGNRILGLIHLADPREDRVPLSVVNVLERLAMQLADGLARIEAEEALEVSEARLMAAQKGAHIADWDLDPQSGRLYWSDEDSRVLGLDPRTTINSLDAFLDLVDPASRARIRTSIELALTRHAPYDIDMRIIRPDGTRATVKNRGQVVLDEAGRATRMVGAMEDITLRRQAEDALHRSEERFRRAVVDSPFPVMLHAEDGQILLVNTAWTQLSGYDGDVLHTIEDWIAKALPHQANAMRKKIKCLYGSDARTDEGELTITTKDGDRRVWDMSSAPLGRVGYHQMVITVARDVTDRTRAEEALRLSQHRLRQAMRTGHMAYFEWDLASGAMTWSDEIAPMLGADPAALPRSMNLFARLACEEDRPRLERHLADVAAGRSPLNIECRVSLPNGGLAHMIAKGDLIPDADAPPHRILGTLLDISEIRQMEQQAALQRQQLEQAAKMASIGVLASGVAHEINNPNYLIMLNVSLLRTVWDNIRPILDHYRAENGDFILAGKPYSEMREEVGDILGDILGGSERIKRIVQELREFAREPARNLTEQVDVNAVIGKALVLLANVIKKKTDQFAVTYAPDLPPVPGNTQRLEQVIVNLVHNACQALSEHGQRISVTTSCEENGRAVVVTIQDEGQGIAADILPRITEPFFTTKRDSGGTGLGLSVSSAIVREHRGQMLFTSTPGAGTTVRLVLPTVHQPSGKE